MSELLTNINDSLDVATDTFDVDGVTVEVTYPTGLARYGAGIAVPATCDIVAIIDHPVAEQPYISQAA